MSPENVSETGAGPPPAEMPWEVDVATVATWLREGRDFLLLDVREREEFELAKIEGAALIPLSELGQRLDELTPHQSRHIVVHCHHGGRSMRVTEALRSRGFPRVQNMAGGIDDWSQQIDPTVPRY